MNLSAGRAIYPIYVQRDSISTFYRQIFELAEDSRKIAQTKGEGKITEKKVSLVFSLLQLMGIEGNYRHENTASSDYTEEKIQIVGPEDKLRSIRQELSKQGLLYDLNYCLKKKRPFGSFVDFECLASIEKIDAEDDNVNSFLSSGDSKFVKFQGSIEDYKFTTICSLRYFEISSWLYGSLKSKSDRQRPFLGFGIVTNFDLEEKELEIKALMFALNTEGYLTR